MPGRGSLKLGSRSGFLIPIRPSILQESFQLRVCTASAYVFRFVSFYPKAKKISRLWRIKMQTLITDQNRSPLYWCCAWKGNDRCELKKEFYPPPSIFYNTMWNDHSQKVFQRPSFPDFFFFLMCESTDVKEDMNFIPEDSFPLGNYSLSMMVSQNLPPGYTVTFTAVQSKWHKSFSDRNLDAIITHWRENLQEKQSIFCQS